ncbi:RING finger domain protein [Penicillium canariense]|uniref:RING finger domain protein n=1 Tax=Penicillium canariense TaxID=189055 RepID=A0A9W9IGN7_9EURO|nr:RING finger domain protein [Penicillium canariense]KAJ5176368.1 RING finger domain protein [Penicillium canariense]
MNTVQREYAGNPDSSSTIVPRISKPRRVRKKVTQKAEDLDSTGLTARPGKGAPKRKARNVLALSADSTGPSPKKPAVQGDTNLPGGHVYEQRPRRWRNRPPQSYLERLKRVSLTRMFVVGQVVGGTEEDPEFHFDVVGSTGNIYKVVIGKQPTCDCPDGRKGNQCKHICYVLLKALKPRPELQYQLGFVSSELREMYEGSPLSRIKATATSDQDHDGKRKPVEGDCPICFMEFEAKDETIWCKAACGNNIHKACFDQWAATSRAQGPVRCVYCRTNWKFDSDDLDIENIRKTGTIGADGYINVAERFGLSPQRVRIIFNMITTYSQWLIVHYPPMLRGGKPNFELVVIDAFKDIVGHNRELTYKMLTSAQGVNEKPSEWD